jgi:hypothetical protein
MVNVILNHLAPRLAVMDRSEVLERQDLIEINLPGRKTGNDGGPNPTLSGFDS